MLYVINSTGRPAATARTVTLLENAGAAPVEVWLPTAQESTAYRAALSGTGALIRIGGGSRSIADGRRDALLAHTDEPLVFVADDLESITVPTATGKRTVPVPDGALPDLITGVFKQATRAGAALWGVGDRATGEPASVGQLVAGPVLWGITAPDPMPYVTLYDDAEWVERSARAYERDGAVLITHDFAASATSDKAPRGAGFAAALARVESRWPGTTAPKPKKPVRKRAPKKAAG